MSTTRSRKDIEFDTRRQVIVDAARRLLAERDIETIAMDEIAASADYTRRTLYAYFKSREEIFLRVLVEDLKRRWSKQQRSMIDAATGLEKIQAWARALFSFSRENPQSIRLQIYWDYRGIDETKVGEPTLRHFKQLNNELAEGLREIFQRGINDGSLRPDLELDLCISQFLYTLRIVIHRALSPGYSFTSHEPDVYVDHFIDLLCRGFVPERNTHGA